MTYNDIIKKAGKRVKTIITYTVNNETTTVNEDNIDRTLLVSKSDLLGTSIRGCELRLKEEIEGTVYVQIQARYGNEVASKTYGPFYIKNEPKYDANKKEYIYTLYDGFIKAMVDYEPLEVTYPITVFNYFSALLAKIGYTTNIQSLPNGNRVMQSELYNDIGYTYRDVLDDIAVANGVLFKIDNNVVSIVQRGTNTVEINDDILKNSNIDFGEHYGPINSIVLSRGGESDNIYIKDDESIEENGLCEFKIVDNQLMRENDRDEYLQALSEQLFGIEYDIYDTELVGYGDILPLDEVTFETGDKEYSSYVFNNEITITSGYKQVIYCDLPEQTETDYKSASKTDKAINQAYIITRKNEAEIEALASKVVDVSAEKTSVGSLQLENAYEGILHKLVITGSMNVLFPKNTQYPKSTLYPLSSMLLIDDTAYDIQVTSLNYLSSTVYDEYIYEDGKAKVIRRVGVSQDETLYELVTPVEEDLGEIYLEVKSNSTIRMACFDYLTYYSEYLLENKYTDTFATQVETSSSINLLGDEIVSEVSKKVDKDEVISTINQSAEEIRITGNRFVVEANNYKLDRDGYMEAISGKIGNWTITGSTLQCEIKPDYDYDSTDVTRVQNIVSGSITPTSNDYMKYDCNKDGRITSVDYVTVKQLYTYHIGKSYPGKIILDTTDWLNPIKVVGGYGEIISWFGVNGADKKSS